MIAGDRCVGALDAGELARAWFALARRWLFYARRARARGDLARVCECLVNLIAARHEARRWRAIARPS